MQCALAWYTGAFADLERQLGVEILLDALLGTNNSPLKAALLAEKLGADIDIGFDDSTLQPTLELLLRGATVDSARKFAPAVRKAVDELLKTGIPHDLLLAALNEAEFASLERPGSLPDGVLDAIYAATGWLHTGDLAREDEDGYYYMVGRKKNLIILGTGENVSPEELERKLNACPEVQECVVKEMGKKIGALICCAEEKQAEVRAFITGLNRTLPLYQRITAVEFSAEPLPRNAMGKLLRR